MTTPPTSREAFEKWAFSHMKNQYHFYDDETIRGYITFRSNGAQDLEAAWQASEQRILGVLEGEDVVESVRDAVSKSKHFSPTHFEITARVLTAILEKVKSA